jgi:hypothetical protein
MKTNNIHQYILNHKQYTQYILLKYKETQEDYNIFCDGIEFENELASKYKINLMPYLYTLEKIYQHEYEGFIMFYKIYLKKAEIDEEPIIDNIVDYISDNIVNLITFIIAMQFYFL